GYRPPLPPHAQEKRAGAAAEIEQPSLAVERQLFAGKVMAFAQDRQTPIPARAWVLLARLAMRRVVSRIKAADGPLAGPRIGEAKATAVALHHHKPLTFAPVRPIRRLDQRGPVRAVAQETGAFLPLHASGQAFKEIQR